jgi:hypothetical protein
MATDKKISELPVAAGINANDISVLVNNGIDYQFSISLLLQFLTSNLSTGAVINFGTVIPQNNTGKNGDLFVKTNSGQLIQKVSGGWTVVYTLPAANGADGAVLYGSSNPSASTGKDLDTYINTVSGIFYLKTSGTWNQVFSMQTGPQGPKGDKGDIGNAGINGKTILNGVSNPSNLIGNDGDYYMNTALWKIYGPKMAGVWGDGVVLFTENSFAVILGNPEDNIALAASLDTKVDKIAGKQLSDENFTSTEKTKLANLSEHYVGYFSTLASLQAAHPLGLPGEYATVDSGVGVDADQYVWDNTDTNWVLVTGPGNVLSVNGQVGPVSLSTDNIGEGSTNKYFTDARVATYGDTRYGRLSANNVWTGVNSFTLSGIGTSIITDGLSVSSTTSTALVTQNHSPLFRISSNEWNTTTGANDRSDFVMQTRGTTGATTQGTLFWSYQNAGGGYTDLMTLLSNGSLRVASVGNTVTANNSQIAFNNNGAYLSRNINDTNTAFTINNNLGTGAIQAWQSAGVATNYLYSSGYLAGSGISNITAGNNSIIAMASTGTIITRNIADANTALIVNQTHTGSTGNILNLQFAGNNRFGLDYNGNAFLFGRLGIGVVSGSIPAQLYIASGIITSAGFGTNAFGINQTAAVTTSTTSSGSIPTVYFNSYGTPTLAASSATTITKGYGNFFNKPLSGTNVNILNSYAAGFNGDIEVQGKINSILTTEQLRLSYDATNFASFTVSSSGQLTINAIGGVTIPTGFGFGFSGGGLWVSATQSSLLPNIPEYSLLGSNNVQIKLGSRANQVAGATPNFSFSNVMFGQVVANIAATGTHPLFANLSLKALSVSAGAGILTNSATLYIEDAATGALNNYAIWSAGGTNRFDGNIQASNATFSGSVIVPTATTSGQAVNKGQLDAKQDILVSGTSIKTINGISILSAGDISAVVTAVSMNGDIGIGTTTGGGQNQLNFTLNSGTGGGQIVKRDGTGSISATNFFGNASTVTNGVYTTTFNSLGDARYLQLSGGTLTGTLNGATGVFTGNVGTTGGILFASGSNSGLSLDDRVNTGNSWFLYATGNTLHLRGSASLDAFSVNYTTRVVDFPNSPTVPTATTATQAVNKGQLDLKANAATTLAGYGITDAIRNSAAYGGVFQNASINVSGIVYSSSQLVTDGNIQALGGALVGSLSMQSTNASILMSDRTNTDNYWSMSSTANIFHFRPINLPDVFTVNYTTSVLTFPISPIVPTATLSTQAVNKGQLDSKLDLAGGTLTGTIIGTNAYFSGEVGGTHVSSSYGGALTPGDASFGNVRVSAQNADRRLGVMMLRSGTEGWFMGTDATDANWNLTVDGSTKFNINRAKGTVTANQFVSNSATPTISLVGLASTYGTGATVSISGNNQYGVITLVTGTGITTGGVLFRVFMSGGFVYPSQCVPTFTQLANGSNKPLGVFGLSDRYFETATVGAVTLDPSTSYTWFYHNGGF